MTTLKSGFLVLIAFGVASPLDSRSARAETLEQATPQNAVRSDWPLPRGDAQSTGRAPQSLPQTLAVRWEFKADGEIVSTPVVSGDLVVVADDQGSVYAIGRGDGKQVWRRDFDDTIFVVSPAIHDGTIVIPDIDGNVYAIDLKTGEQRWKQTTSDGIEISGAAAFHANNVLVTSQDAKLYCFALKDGTPQWTYEAQDQIRCSPTIAGDRTFLGGCDGQLHIVNLQTGKAMGEPLPLAGPTGSTPAVQGNKAFVPIMDGLVYAFDFETRKELWQHEDQERAQSYENSAAISKDLVVVASENRQVDAIEIETGKRRWRYTLRRRPNASPVIAGDDVWIASTDGRLTRLSLEDGSEKWTYEIRGTFLAAPAIAGEELYIADDDGIVRCFAAKS